mgnify:CR=1 FL=1
MYIICTLFNFLHSGLTIIWHIMSIVRPLCTPTSEILSCPQCGKVVLWDHTFQRTGFNSHSPRRPRDNVPFGGYCLIVPSWWQKDGTTPMCWTLMVCWAYKIFFGSVVFLWLTSVFGYMMLKLVVRMAFWVSFCTVGLEEARDILQSASGN